MNSKLVKEILMNKRPVRETIERFSVNEGPLSDLADALDAEDAGTASEEPDADNNKEMELVANDDEFPVKQFFVRLYMDADDPQKFRKAKCASIAEALKVFFEWATTNKSKGVSIWTSDKPSAKNFYRFVVKNREQIEPLWKACFRANNTMKWSAVWHDALNRTKQNGANLTGDLEPFHLLGK